MCCAPWTLYYLVLPLVNNNNNNNNNNNSIYLYSAIYPELNKFCSVALVTLACLYNTMLKKSTMLNYMSNIIKAVKR